MPLTLPAYRDPASQWRGAAGGLVLVMFGGVFLYFLVPEIWASLTASRWAATPCTILSSRVETAESGEGIDRQTLYRLEVRYRYEASAGRHESTRYRFANPYTENRAAAETGAATYSPGAVVTCYVDPADPQQAVLDRQMSPLMLLALLPAAIAGAGLWTLIGIVRETIGRLT